MAPVEFLCAIANILKWYQKVSIIVIHLILNLPIQNEVPRTPSIDNNPVSNNIVSHDNITSHNISLCNNNVTPDNEIIHSAQKRHFTSAMKKLADNAPGRREQPLAATRRHAQPP